MKKIICLLAIGLMIASVALAAPKMKIASDKLGALKGTWEGIIGFGMMEAATSPAKLEILNDAVPVRAKLTIWNVPSQIASQLGLMGGQNIFESDDGTITTQGTLMFTGKQPKNFFEVSLAGEKKLKAWYYFQGLRGDATLKKK